jgi:HEAT repeat protein
MDCLGERLRSQFDYIATHAEATFQEFQKGDNRQGHNHCEAVEKNLDILIPDIKKENSLSETEIFVLLAAAHLHDIGKIEGSNRSGWKSEHGHRGMEIINQNYDKLGLDRVQAIAVGYLVSVHGHGRLDQLPPKPMVIGTDEVHIIELAAIFRLADMLDTTYQRAPELVARILFSDGNVPEKWQARQTIAGWTLDERNRIVLQAIPATDEIGSAYVLKNMINEDLAKIAPHLRLAGYPWELAELDVDALQLGSSLGGQSHQDRPFPGMAYYEEDQANIFRGREVETEKLLSVVSNSPIVLLIGESGSGKTSLIHAGLFPRLRAMMWDCVWTRPLGNPRVAIRDLIWRATLEGPVKSECSLWEVMSLAAEKCRPRNLLIAMDQFEDVLNSPQTVLDELAQDLVTVQARYVIPNLRVLVSFREDSLVRLSTRLLKAITGSARQFPSVELERLSRDGAKQALLAGLENARIGLDPRQEESQKPLIEIILDDIQQADDRLYPPYLQMIAETLCTMVDRGNPIISREKYFQSGGANEIIAHYLIRRLDEFGPRKKEARSVLVFLTSSAGKKAQKVLSALSQATGIETDPLREILGKMIDLRMVRRIDTDEYEIIHDHLGRLVDAELVGKEDRELKFLQEQLEAAQRLYEVHREPIRSSTVWVSLYRNRRRIVIGQEKHLVLFCSYLWNISYSDRERQPIRCGWYWLRSLPHADLLVLSTNLIKHDESKISGPAAQLLVDLVTRDDLTLVTDMLEDRDERIRRVAVEAIGKLGTSDELSLIVEMLKDKSGAVRLATVEALGKLGSREEISLITEMLKDDNGEVRRAAVKALGKLGSRDDLSLLDKVLTDDSGEVRRAAVEAFGKLGIRDDLSVIAEMVEDLNTEVCMAAMDALEKLATHDDLTFLSSFFKNETQAVRVRSVRAFGKLVKRDDLGLITDMLDDEDENVRWAAVEAFSNVGTRDDLGLISGMLKDEDENVRWEAATAFGKLVKRDDLSLIIDMLKHENEDVRRAAAQGISEIGTHDDLSLIGAMLNDEDANVREGARLAFRNIVTRDDLGLLSAMLKDGNDDVRRAAAEAFSKVGTHDDWSLISAILNDESWEVGMAALWALSRLATRDDLSLVTDILKKNADFITGPAVDAFKRLVTRDDLGLITDNLESESKGARDAAADALAQVASDLDAEGLLDLLAERSQGWDPAAASHFHALCLLDRKFYCPIPPK